VNFRPTRWPVDFPVSRAFLLRLISGFRLRHADPRVFRFVRQLSVGLAAGLEGGHVELERRQPVLKPAAAVFELPDLKPFLGF
jgi:hypothetical protein